MRNETRALCLSLCFAYICLVHSLPQQTGFLWVVENKATFFFNFNSFLIHNPWDRALLQFQPKSLRDGPWLVLLGSHDPPARGQSLVAGTPPPRSCVWSWGCAVRQSRDGACWNKVLSRAHVILMHIFSKYSLHSSDILEFLSLYF